MILAGSLVQDEAALNESPERRTSGPSIACVEQHTASTEIRFLASPRDIAHCLRQGARSNVAGRPALRHACPPGHRRRRPCLASRAPPQRHG